MPSRRIRRLFAGAAVLALSPLLSSCRGGSAPPEEDWDRHVQEVQQRGAPLVRAIYKFKATCGLWPCSLDELVPDYASDRQVAGWAYSWRPSDWWSLKDFGSFPKELLCYEFHGPHEAGWLASNGEDEDAWLKGGEVAAPTVDVSAEEKDAAHLSLMRARVARYKNKIIHHKGLICWYYTRGEYEKARDACANCLQRWPGHWWPNLMMAYIEQKLKRNEDADARLARFTSDHDDLTHWYLATVFRIETGKPDRARKELARAGQVPLADLEGTGESNDGEVLGYSTGAGIAWNAAVLCYRQGWCEEGLAVSDQWELYCKKNYGKEYGALQAACYLALGKAESAREPLRQTIEESKKRNVWPKNLKALEEAIDRKDRAYRYDPGDYPEPFTILVDYH